MVRATCAAPFSVGGFAAPYVQDMYTRFLSANLDFDSELQHVFFFGHLASVATLEYFTLTVFFSVFVERCSRVWFGCIERYTWLAVLTRTHVFPGHGMYSSGPRGNSRVLGIVAVWSTAVEIC